jgi:RNA polymerase sigma factor (sigma-70 family)
LRIDISENDVDLIQKIKDGDSRAFRPLIEKYKDLSLSIACSIIKDRDSAEDVLQEAFIKAYDNIHRFKFNAKFSTWLYRIVVNTSYNALKKIKTQLSISDQNVPADITLENMTLDQLKAEDQRRYVTMALDNLRADETLVLRLFYLCELKIAEIQKITGYKESKIKVDLHHGRRNLNDELKRLLGNELKDLL